ncbi:putative Diguanylate cyclase with PAS/PAC sensor [Thiocapsa sp. KS1]|nr:CHASE domain-containing protein [Thiocapsa sp. KS1]CRI67705.1 putative Diguanylate cyclase with PAS/PAC sensor [Thiocapsa sp. KS1]
MKTPRGTSLLSRAALWLLPWTVLALGLGATFLLWQANRHAAELELEVELRTRAAKIAYSIDYRLRNTIQVLRGVAALFDASGEVTRDEFRRYVEGLGVVEHYPGMQGIGFSRFIPADRLADHLASVRAEGFPDYRIRPEGERSFYTAVLFLEPFSGRNLSAFGYDMSPDPVRWAAASRARDSGEPALSGKVTLVQETQTDRQPGFLIFVPVFPNLPAADVVTRRANLFGWAYSPVRMDDMMRGVLDAVGLEGSVDAFEVSVYDGDRLTRDSLLFASEPWDPASASASGINAIQRIEPGGHPWAIQVLPRPGFAAERISRESTPFALIGGISSLLFALLVGVLVASHRRVADALRLADRANGQLRERERDLLWAQCTAQLGNWSLDVASGRVSWSEGLFRIWGLDPSRDAPSYEVHRDLMAPGEWSRLDRAVSEAVHEGKPYQIDLSIRRADGAERSLIAIGTPERDAEGHVVRLTGTVQDVTDRKRAEAALYFTQTVVDRMGDAAYWTSSEGRIRYVNAAASHMLGYGREELLGMSAMDIEPQYTRERWDTHWLDLQRAGSMRLESVHRRKDGVCIPVEISVDHFLFDGVEYACGLVRDIGERQRIQEMLREQAVRDPLTGLFNRRYLDETLPRELRYSQRNGEPLAVAMLDLDHFKVFNDRFGHDAGDAALRAIGDLLRTSLRAGDIACRYGGEEITLVLPGAGSAEAAKRLDTLRRAMTRLRLVSRERELPPISVSIGVAAVAPDETDPGRVLARADAAMYRAKRQGRNRVVISEESEGIATVRVSEKDQDRQIVADAAREHEEVPNAVRPGEAAVECVEDDAEGVEKSADDEAPKTCLG